MVDAAVCVFAWDLGDEGIDHVLGAIRELGATSVFLATSYHAGWFLLPHNPQRMCYMVEDGVVYFHPTDRLYRQTPLKPLVARIAKDTDWLAEAGERARRFDLRLTAWNVCFHNTRLGLAHPEHTVRNALGDSYPHALCPASPAARRYLRAMAADLASRYPLQSIFLEAPNYRGRRHGHHHERTIVPLGALENALLDVSFSEADLAAAEAVGVDARRVQAVVRDHLLRFLAAAGGRSQRARTLEDFLAEHPELGRYQAALEASVKTLLQELHDDLAAWGVAMEGCEHVAAYDVLIVGVYGLAADEVARRVRASAAEKMPHQSLRVGFCLGETPGSGSRLPADESQLRECVDAAAAAGATGFLFYNYSESSTECLRWIKSALPGAAR